jgi:outer membrane lipoprotein-sorting protein
MKTLITLAFLILAGSIYAQDNAYKLIAKNDIPAFISKIERASASLTTLQSSFTQKKEISVLAESVTSKGILLYKKENKLCWEYSTPYFYLFALNGDKVYIKNDKSTKEFDTKSNALFKEISVLLMNSISGTGLIDPKKFDAVFYDNATSVKVQLTPKNKALKSMLKTITLYFNKTGYLVHTIEMMEPSGDSTTIVFKETKTNQPINDEKFVVHK